MRAETAFADGNVQEKTYGVHLQLHWSRPMSDRYMSDSFLLLVVFCCAGCLLVLCCSGCALLVIHVRLWSLQDESECVQQTSVSVAVCEIDLYFGRRPRDRF